MTEPRVYTLELPAGMQLLTLNQRLHPKRRNDYTQAIRQAAAICARNARIPRLERVHITAYVHHKPTARRRDSGNWYLTAKAAVDGLVDAQVLEDDDDTHVTGPDMRPGEPVAGGQLVLEIREVLT